MLIVTEAKLKEIARRLVLGMGATPEVADIMTDALVSANLEGVDSHGVMRLPHYAELADEGLIVPRAEPEVVRQDRAITLVDGHWCFGQVGARFAAALAVESAKAHGIAATGLFHAYHVGRLVDYVQYIGKQGMIGIALCSASVKGGAVVPFRGKKRVFGTNPLAWAVPGRSGRPLVADYATSVTAEGKLHIAIRRKQSLPDGTIINREGRPTNEASEFFAGGALLPFGGHKGYALSLFNDIMGGLLVGAGCAAMVPKSSGNGLLLIALDVAALRPLDEFENEVEKLLAIVKAVPPAPGQEPVLLPGEPEAICREQRSRDGIPIEDETWDRLVATGQKLGVPPEIFAL